MKKFLILSLLGWVLACTTTKAQPSNQSPNAAVRVDPRLDQQVPLNLTFKDETGKTVKLSDYANGSKPIILTLVYFRCPGLCTRVLNGMTTVLEDLAKEQAFHPGKQFTVLSVSFDPRDNPQLAQRKKQAYVERLGLPNAEQHWHFLTGGSTEIKKLTDAVGFRYRFDKKTQEYQHPSCIIVLSPRGKITHYFWSLEPKARDLRLALSESSQFKVGTLKDRFVILTCYSFNPTTGEYAFSPINVVRISGSITLLIFGGFLLKAWFSKKKASPAPSEQARLVPE